MGYELKDGDVAIIISPDTEEDGSWTGILKTGLIFGEEQHPIEDYPELIDYFDDARHNLLKEMFPKQYAESQLEIGKENEYTTDGNVIKLTKWTKTLGEA